MSNHKILIFELKNVCYNSYLYFAEAFGKCLEKSGYDITYFRISEEPLENIERFIDESYDAVIEFNSDLPKIQMDDDSFFLNHIDAPFFDIILDHPLYHHDMLKHPIENFHVICLDENHKSYILENYPHIKSVHTMPMTGEEIFPTIPFTDREIPLLFSGTYTSPREVWTAIENCPPFLGEDIKTLISRMLENPTLTIEQATKELAPESDSLILENFPLHVQAYFLADTYLRAYLREQVIHTLIDAKIPVTLYGTCWEKMPGYENPYLKLHESVTFQDSFILMQHSQVTLNTMPLFKNGFHDRIASAMLNGSISLTDSSLYLNEHFNNDKDILFYDLSSIEKLPDIVNHLFSNKNHMIEIAHNGYENAKAHYTWEHNTALFLSILSSIS